MTQVFVDTGAFVALDVRRDRHHRAAADALTALIERGPRFVASNYVFGETYTTLLARSGRQAAIQWGRRMRAGAQIEFVPIDQELEDSAWEILEQHPDKDWSYVDATSFALMEREGINTAFAFDDHFRQRGLAVVPAEAPS